MEVEIFAENGSLDAMDRTAGELSNNMDLCDTRDPTEFDTKYRHYTVPSSCNTD